MIDVGNVIPTGNPIITRKKRMKKKKGMRAMVFYSPIVSFQKKGKRK